VATRPIVHRAAPARGRRTICSRAYSQSACKRIWDSRVIVENKPGAGGNVGTEFVAKQPATATPCCSRPTPRPERELLREASVRPIKDFEPGHARGTIPFVLTVIRISRDNVKEFLAYARSHPGSTYATAGIGTPHTWARSFCGP